MDESARSAREAGLNYVSGHEPGLIRRRCGSGFTYRNGRGLPVADTTVLARIRSLAIPPAWTEVWISADPHGHIQATGRDGKGRKQYIYHESWQEIRGESKYEKLATVARRLPRLRSRIEEDIRRPVPSKPRVLATVVRLLETTLIRIGNSKYAKENDSYGLTTLRNEHVEVEGSRMLFDFKGKSGKVWRVSISDRRLANAIRVCQELPGQHLFEYVENGECVPITSNDVNEYLRQATASDLSAKDIRTWAGTVLMAAALADAEPPRSPTHAKRLISAEVKKVAARLGNTPAVCRGSYVHPRVIEAYLNGELRSALDRGARSRMSGLGPEERGVLMLLESDEAKMPAGAPSGSADEAAGRSGSKQANDVSVKTTAPVSAG